ncbi:hypothetical protein ERJ75_000331300 [Trypanosoma vivax]|uniref:SKP1 component POZ domain-containing protein n=1 Tax=Trypanosoma vivax (strain Y486) TaxID=1055687 RepID=G0UAI7_TRYVY|nr:hypothetical protein TRVL_03776 [Trypanosoma vivax]KAH8617854.1 hypothetical protein ERJ75_000331300 [Trypanosoma vivax]CCC52820.1 conserved hypothetical protein [Trypanosoma vivax Y486]
MSSFTLISAAGERVAVPLEPGVVCQSLWLQAAVDAGEEEGIVPVSHSEALKCLVEYMVLQAKQEACEMKQERLLTMPCTTSCPCSSEGLGYDMHAMLPPSDVAFLDACCGQWDFHGQALLLELLVTADYLAHNRLKEACAIYIGCRLMSSTESDILGWFPGEASAMSSLDEASGELLLSDAERLRILKEMKKIIVVGDSK